MWPARSRPSVATGLHSSYLIRTPASVPPITVIRSSPLVLGHPVCCLGLLSQAPITPKERTRSPITSYWTATSVCGRARPGCYARCGRSIFSPKRGATTRRYWRHDVSTRNWTHHSTRRRAARVSGRDCPRMPAGRVPWPRRSARSPTCPPTCSSSRVWICSHCSRRVLASLSPRSDGPFASLPTTAGYGQVTIAIGAECSSAPQPQRR